MHNKMEGSCKMKTRDITIDRLRGFAMLWVILVHVLYWGNFFDNQYVNLLKSAFLFEMPLFFFVTGASNSFHSTKGYFNFVFKRYKRILIPYWIFALVCALLSIFMVAKTDVISFGNITKILFSWLLPLNKQITSVPYLTWAIWFVPVYLCLVLVLPFLKQLKTSYKIKPVFALFALFLLFVVCNLEFLQTLCFYSMWTYLGLFYNEILPLFNEKTFLKKLNFAIIGTIGLMLLLFVFGSSPNMQYNKFPPNLMFACFSVVALSVIIKSVPVINKIYNFLETSKLTKKILELYSCRSLTIFLYQVFAFLLTIRLANLLIPYQNTLAGLIKSVFCFALTIPTCALFSLLFGKIEDLGLKKQ